MANVTGIQVLADGPRNTVLKLTGILDTSDQPYTIIADPALLSPLWPDGPQQATRLKVKKIQFNVEDGLDTRLYWDATPPVLIESLTGRGKYMFQWFGDLYPPANAPGLTGKIGLLTEGWITSNILEYTVELELHKS